MDSVVITKSLFESFTIMSSNYKGSNPKDWKGVYDDIVYGLFIYSIYEFLKFLFLATLGDIITTIKGNYDSPERDRAIKRDLWTVAKSIIAFIIACILF